MFAVVKRFTNYLNLVCILTKDSQGAINKEVEPSIFLPAIFFQIQGGGKQSSQDVQGAPVSVGSLMQYFAG